MNRLSGWLLGFYCPRLDEQNRALEQVATINKAVDLFKRGASRQCLRLIRAQFEREVTDSCAG
jgi:hypothetical protein